MVIEFMGIPGSGKSFLGNSLSETLNKKKIKSINILDKSRHEIKYKILFKIWHLAAYKSKIYAKTYKIIKKEFSDYQNIKAGYNVCSINDYIDVIAFYVFLYEKLKDKKKIYIFDEGIFQQLSTIYVNYNLTYESLDSVLKYVEKYIPKTIYMRTDVDVAIASIKKRNRHVCYIDELEGEELRTFLNKYIKISERFVEKKGIYIINRSDSSDANVKKVYNYIHM